MTYCELDSDLQSQKLVKICKNAPESPWIQNIQSGASVLYQDIFNDYVWSYIIGTDMPECFLTCFRVMVVSRATNWSKICQKCQLCPLNSDLVPQNCAKAYSMSIYGHMSWKRISQYARWLGLKFMMVSRDKNWLKISQKYQLLPLNP